MELKPAIEALLDKEGDAPLGGRTREEIIERLTIQASDGAAPQARRRRRRDDHAHAGGQRARRPPRWNKSVALTKSVAAKMEKPLAAMEARLAALDGAGRRSRRGALRRAFRAQSGILHRLRVRVLVGRQARNRRRRALRHADGIAGRAARHHRHRLRHPQRTAAGAAVPRMASDERTCHSCHSLQRPAQGAGGRLFRQGRRGAEADRGRARLSRHRGRAWPAST